MPADLAEALARARTESRPVLVPYFMVDSVRVGVTGSIVRAAHAAGADAVELGFPFSDPIADGPLLQAAATRALAHGTQWRDLLQAIRYASDELPVAVMTYANPVYRHGLDSALRVLHDQGASGLIVPDLSWEESRPWQRAAESAGLALVQMASPATPLERVRTLASGTRGFLYLVSQYGTTGGSGFDSTPTLAGIVEAAHDAAPETPVLLGFGIRRAKDAVAAMAVGADGVSLEVRLRRPSDRNPTSNGAENSCAACERFFDDLRKHPKLRQSK